MGFEIVPDDLDCAVREARGKQPGLRPEEGEPLNVARVAREAGGGDLKFRGSNWRG
jgi:hypothetical protein